MLRIDIEGDTHPKTFRLVTDDGNAELAHLVGILNEVEADAEDPIRVWLDAHSADEFAEGVVIPTEEVGEFAELLEADWPNEAGKVYAQAEDAMNQAEAALGERDEAAEAGDQ